MYLVQYLSLDDAEEEVGRTAATEKLSQLQAAVHCLHQLNHRGGKSPGWTPGEREEMEISNSIVSVALD